MIFGNVNEDQLKRYKDVANAKTHRPEINLQVKGYIPTDYILDLNQRLEVYRRLQLFDSLDECAALENELTDRYGKFSEPVAKLLVLIVIKILCKKIHINILVWVFFNIFMF